ncbi:MAG: hypothetical protein RL662_289 [Bacteroidota bacterium]|jgi:hypothetical protein
MKKNILFLLTILLSLSTAFISCSKDDDEKNENNNSGNYLLINSERIDAANLSNLDGLATAIEYTTSKKQLEIISNFYLKGKSMSRSFGVYIYNINVADIPIGTNLISSTSQFRCSAYYLNMNWARTVWNEKGKGEIILTKRDIDNNTLTFEFKNVEFDDTPISSGDGKIVISGIITEAITVLK